MTYGEAVSRVINTYNSLNKDQHISRRYVLHLIQNKKLLIVSRKLRDFSLLDQEKVLRYIDCFELEPEDTKKCHINVNNCQHLMKSKEQIPDLHYSRLGSSLIRVETLDGQKIDNVKSKKSYFNRPFTSDKTVGYYVKDSYLYIVNQPLKMVNLALIPVKEEDLDKENKECKSLWDYSLNLPDDISEAVIMEVYKDLGIHKQIPADPNPNMNALQ